MPKLIGDRFAELIIGRYDKKKQWVGACAAILMYLDASEDEQRRYDELAQQTMGGNAAKVMAKLKTAAKASAARTPKT